MAVELISRASSAANEISVLASYAIAQACQAWAIARDVPVSVNEEWC